MIRRLMRSLGALLLIACALVVASPAMAANKTVNGITADTILPQIQRGVAYSFQLAPTGPGAYTGPYTFSFLSGAFPAGITLSRSGLVSGTTCSAIGNYSPQNIRIVDNSGRVADFTGGNAFSVNVTTAPANGCSVTVTANLPPASQANNYNGRVTASGTPGPYTYTVSSGALPQGLALQASTGTISGFPQFPGTYSFSILATDNSSTPASTGVGGPFTIVVSGGGTTTVNPPTLPNGANGTPYSQTLSASGGTPPYAFAVTGGGQPAGLTLAADGVLSGTPTVAGTYTFTVTATNFNGGFGSRAYSVTIAPGNILTINPATLPNGTSGTAYSETVSATVGTGPYTFAITSGSLPTGLSLASTGALTGTPTAPGTYSFTVTGTDANGDFGTRSYSVTIAAGNTLTINPASLPGGATGTAYSETVTATGGTGSYAFAITAGALPTGLSLASTGAVTGTPTTPGTYSFTVTGTDVNGDFGTRNYSVTIAGGNTLTINPSTLPNAATGTAYSQALTATGGVGPYAFAITAGALPAGVTLASNGTLSGTPIAAGMHNFTVTGTDANGNFGTRNYSLIVAPGNILTVNPSSLPNGTAGAAYSQTISATGGTGPYTFAVASGTLPTGLTLATNGALTGTPTTPGTYNFTVTGTDANGDVGTRSYGVTIAVGNTLTINPSMLPSGTAGTAYSQALSATGGTAPYSFAVTAGALPAGLTLSSAGALSGTPTTPGTYNFTVTGTDANGNVGTRSYSVTIAAGNTLTINPTSLPGATTGAPYSETVTATGGTGPYTFAVTGGALPSGLTLGSNGVLSGTPAGAGTYSFTVTGTDANSNFGTRTYSGTVAAGNILTVNPATLPNGTTGAAYSQIVSASGGTGPYAFAVATGALPAGLTLNASTGALTGTPTSAGSASFTIRATDSRGDFGTRPYMLNIGAGQLLTINPATLPSGTNGTAYAQTLTAAGGTGPYRFAVTAGALPNGLVLASNGALSGTPTRAGSYTFTVTGTDANGDFGSRSYTVTIAGAQAVTVTPGAVPGGNAGSPYNLQFVSNGGTGPYTYTYIAGSLPPGITLTPGGLLSGTPTTPGTYTFTVQSVDANGNFGVLDITLVVGVSIRPDPTLDPGVSSGVTEQVGATRRAGELQMSHVMRRLGSPSNCTSSEESGTADDCKRVSAWATGTREQNYTARSNSSLTALTVGADTEIGNAQVGAAIGTGQDKADMESGFRNDADSTSILLYGRVPVQPNVHVEAVAGRAWINMDSRRRMPNASEATGTRDGDVTFGSIGITGAFNFGAFGLQPYARYETIRIDLDGYTEASTSPLALQYGGLKTHTSSWVAGTEASYGMQFDWGRLTPSARVEFRDRSGEAIAQGLWYADRPGTVYVLNQAGVDSRSTMAALGIEAAFRGFTLKLEYGTAGSALSNFDGQSIQLQIRAGF